MVMIEKKVPDGRIEILVECRGCGETEKIVRIPQSRLCECGVCGRKFPVKR